MTPPSGFADSPEIDLSQLPDCRNKQFTIYDTALPQGL